MKKFIELTNDWSGKKILFNVDNIICVAETDKWHTEIWYAGGDENFFAVKEDYPTVLSLMREATE